MRRSMLITLLVLFSCGMSCADVVIPEEVARGYFSRINFTLSPYMEKKNTLKLRIQPIVRGRYSFSLSLVSGDVETKVKEYRPMPRHDDDERGRNVYFSYDTPPKGESLNYRLRASFSPYTGWRKGKFFFHIWNVKVYNAEDVIHVFVEKELED
ncbi:MAG: hypothetical protein IJG65_04865 [Synergistaceae bacterium]|nr:hypothetical protein [Synergistaceae bacterium]